jgi:hypothetical protein
MNKLKSTLSLYRKFLSFQLNLNCIQTKIQKKKKRETYQTIDLTQQGHVDSSPWLRQNP